MRHSLIKLGAGLLLAAMTLAAPALARDHDRGGHDRDRSGHSGHYDGRGGYSGQHSRDSDRIHAYPSRGNSYSSRGRYDRGHYGRGGYGHYRPAPPPRYRAAYYRPAPRYYGPSHRWARGGRYYGPGYGPTYVVGDYGHYGLRRPPYGYGWRRSDTGDFLLVALATGIIADLVIHGR